jgi:multisubunit Na+/H+ antiporter MnhB subunit
MSVAFDAVLCLLVVLAAIRVVATTDLRAAVGGFLAYGMLLALVWVRLESVDIALTEVAVGSGLTTIVILRAISRMPVAASSSSGSSPTRSARVAVGLMCAVVTLGLSGVLLALPDPAPSIAPYVAQNMPATALGNPIAGVLMVFRAMDTVLETVVVLLALIGVWAMVPQHRLAEVPGPLAPGRAPEPVVFLARALVPFGLLFGAYQMWAGADVPGGKFQGAAVLASMGLLLMMAGVVTAPAATNVRLRALLLVGPILFLAVGVAGWPLAGAFLGYPAGLEKPVIIAVEIASTISIALALVMLVLGPPAGSASS